MKTKQDQAVQSQAEPTGCLPVILRVTWMAYGNLALIVFAGLVAQRTAPVATDIAFFASVLALIVIRYVDITRYAGRTTEGEPATLGHWRRYAVLLTGVSVVLWALARVAASRGWM